ncbi:hypothetical protein CR513_59454, partial [Mucuna pruriens]
MTFDQSLLHTTSKTYHTYVSNANDTSSLVTSVGTVVLTRLLSLEHTLLVPSLSNNLLSMSQDLSNKEIIGRGTKRRRLYYVDDICSDNSKLYMCYETSNLDVTLSFWSCIFWLHDLALDTNIVFYQGEND